MYARKCAFLLFAIVAFATISQAQLTNTKTSGSIRGTCGITHQESTFSNWVYADSSGVHGFSGSTTVIASATFNNNGKIEFCPGFTSTLDTNSSDGEGYHLHAVGGAGTITEFGAAEPKYVVLAIIYAPPGASSSVNYG